MGVVARQDWNGLLQDDDSVVELLVDEVDGASGYLYSVVEGLLLGVEAGEGGEQRWMDVEDALREGLDELGREQAHVACQAHQVHIMRAQGGDDFFIVFGALAAFGFDGDGVEAPVACGSEAGCVGFIRDDYGDLASFKFSGGDVIGDGEEVGASSGEEDAELFFVGHTVAVGLS